MKPSLYGLGLCIDHDAKTSHIGRHLTGEREHRPQQRASDAFALRTLIDGEPL